MRSTHYTLGTEHQNSIHRVANYAQLFNHLLAYIKRSKEKSDQSHRFEILESSLSLRVLKPQVFQSLPTRTFEH